MQGGVTKNTKDSVFIFVLISQDASVQVQFAIMTYRLDISFSVDTELPLPKNTDHDKKLKSEEIEDDGPQNTDDKINESGEDP